MNYRIAFAFLAPLTLVPSLYIVAQNAPGALPHDPMALMTLAHDKNGLVGSDIKPWHIHATYHVFDTKGKPEYEGAYEEWWINATRYRLSFTNPKSTQTDYATGTVLLRDGSQEWQSGPELLLRASLLEPLPDVSQLKEFTLQQRTQAVGQSSIDCVSLTYPLRPMLEVSANYYPAACLEQAMPVLRMFSEETSTRIIYDRIVVFQGHYLARQIQVFVSGKLVAEMDTDVIEPLKEPTDAVLVPPATALPVDLTKILLKDTSRNRWPTALKKAVPVYPQQAKLMRIQGTVNIKGTIGPDGHVENMQPIDGPGMLRQAALDAVRQWIYRPFNVMGQPRSVEVELHIIFNLG
jgi:TonB family protein